MTLVIALTSLALLSVFATSLVVVTDTEQRAAANYAASRDAMYAADGALQIAARGLLMVPDWNAVLSTGTLSAFVDGPPSGVRLLGAGPRSI
jgi:Tfp pilus assembly protein PilX